MSAFLTESDYAPLIQDHVLSQVITNDPTLLDEAELMALSEMESYLAGRFDTATVFSTTGTGRHRAIVMYALDITLYHLHSRVTPRNVSKLREDRYMRALEWLDKVVTGELSPNLPVKTDPDGDVDNRLKWGSNEKPHLRF